MLLNIQKILHYSKEKKKENRPVFLYRKFLNYSFNFFPQQIQFLINYIKFLLHHLKLLYSFFVCNNHKFKWFSESKAIVRGRIGGWVMNQCNKSVFCLYICLSIRLIFFFSAYSVQKKKMKR